MGTPGGYNYSTNTVVLLVHAHTTTSSTELQIANSVLPLALRGTSGTGSIVRAVLYHCLHVTAAGTPTCTCTGSVPVHPYARQQQQQQQQQGM